MENTSGIEPMEHNVLIRPVEVDRTTKGGVWLPDDHREREQWAETRGTVVAVSPYAFEDFGGAAAKPGDQVIMARHVGKTVKGIDGVEYRIVKDVDCVAKMRGDYV